MATGTGRIRYGLNRKRSHYVFDGRRPDHVVVFVHGMGKALKGGTLQEWAQPLMQSLYDLALDGLDEENNQLPRDEPLVIDEAYAVGDPSEVWVRVLRGYTGNKPNYTRILMTESSWASDFAPATAVSTYWWAAMTARLVYRRYMSLVFWNLYPGRRSRKWWLAKRLAQILLYMLAMATGFVLMVAAIVGLAVLLGLALVPGLHRLLGKLVTLFADFLGDPQVWMRKPLQAAAMRQRVSDTLLRWDGEYGVPVTVVAHSQGAAICGQLLFQNKYRARATNFVTVGSGISLLGYAQWGGRSKEPVDDWLHNDPGMRWINVWGKFDFVPAGPIGEKRSNNDRVFKKVLDRGIKDSGGAGPEEHPVYNRSALIKDHVVYSKNRIEVIDPLARMIFLEPPAQGQVQFTTYPKDGRLRPHRVMVKSLGVTRLLAALSGALSAPAFLSWLGSHPWTRGLLQCNTLPNNQDPWWSSWVCSKKTIRWAFGWDWSVLLDWFVLGLTALLLAVVLLGVLNGVLWEFLHGKLERRRRMRRRTAGGVNYSLTGLNLKAKWRELKGPRTVKPVASPWVWVAIYLTAAAALAVAIPIIVMRPSPSWVVVYACFAAIWMLCFTETSIEPLAARRPPKPSSEKTEPGSGAAETGQTEKVPPLRV